MNDSIRTVSSSATAHRREVTYTHASRLIKIAGVWPEGQALDVFDGGCGDARLSVELVRQGHRVVGLDVNEQGVAAAAKAGVEAKLGDLERPWPVKEASFDVVMLVDVLEHTVDQAFVLSEARRVLKPGGCLILTYLNHFDLKNRWLIFRGKKSAVHWDHFRYGAKPWSYTHYRYLTWDEFHQLLEANGFGISVEQVNFMGGSIVPRRGTPKFARRFLVNRWPGLFSGKFIVRATTEPATGPARRVVLPATPPGL